jgi:hypothetical protein
LDSKESVCRNCGQNINLAADGAWEDPSGACGCGEDEHEPTGENEYPHNQMFDAWGQLERPWGVG